MGQYQYLTPDNVVETYKTSKQYTEGLTDLFFEYERIARNKPHSSIPKEYPKTTDGTTASIIRKTPHRIIQQIPNGNVISDTNDWLSVVASFIYQKKIIPNANEGYALLQKCWNIVERSLTFGYCPIYTPFVQHAGYFCTDMRLPYWGDIFMQPGKISDSDANYLFMRSWWQTKDIEALIASQEKIDKKNRTWDTATLAQVKEYVTTKEEKAKTPAEREKNINTKGGIELVTGFQRGVGAKFFTFNPQSELIVRTKANKDPRGEIPLRFAYGDIDGSNPFGRSAIDLVGGIQNLIDGQMQMHQYREALMLNPPLIKRGNFNKNKIKFAPNVIIDVGASPDATVEPLKIDTTANANFSQNYGLMKSQLLNLLASPDTSISADIGNPGFSKTPQGVEAGKANLNIDDNYMRKQFETVFEGWSEDAINLYFAERSGIEELQLDSETADKLKDLAEDGKFDPNLLSDDNKIRIDYDSATEKLKFRVDPTSSKQQDDAEQLALIQEALKTVSPQVSYYMGQDGWKFNTGEAYRVLLEKMGIENISDIVTKMNQKEAEEAKQQPFPIIDPPTIRLNSADLTAEQLAAALQMGGVNPPQSQQPQPGGPPPGLSPQGTADFIVEMIKAQAQSSQPQAAPPQDTNQVTPDHVLKADDQAHKQVMEQEKLKLEAAKTGIQAKQADQQAKTAMIAAKQPKVAAKPAAKKAK